MKKVIRLNESELVNLIKTIINESIEKKITDGKLTDKIKTLLGVKDLSKGKFKLIYGTNSGGIRFYHPDFDNIKNKKAILIPYPNKYGIPDGGTWSINGTSLILKK